MIAGLVKGIIGAIIGTLAVIGIIGGLLFGSLYLINGGDRAQAATVQFKAMDILGTGAGVTYGGLPVLIDSAHKGADAVHKVRCQSAPKSQACAK